MEFKKLSDVEVVAEPTESANVLIEENGVIKKTPKTAVGGAGVSSEWDAILSFEEPLDYGVEGSYLQGSHTILYDKFVNQGQYIKVLVIAGGYMYTPVTINRYSTADDNDTLSISVMTSSKQMTTILVDGEGYVGIPLAPG